ncbi:histidine kinase [Hymenobacter sp.]|uniref:sensor histidine kinase n=1 Tax=Hymenobacter sp. TaxID=1898978 RepID=UPI00286A3AB9|nr:histidine kinase [Hymenobacter sp.]
MERLETWFRWLVPPLIGGAAYAVLLLLSQFEKPDGFVWFVLLHYVLLMAAFYEGSRFIARRLDRHLPWTGQIGKRLAVQLLTSLAYSSVVTLLSYTALKLFMMARYHQPDHFGLYHLSLMGAYGLLLALLVNAVLLGLGFLQFWQQEKLRAERWQQESTRAQLESLKDQVNPHFLFNSFNILSELIDDDPAAAKHFVDKMAEVYRYVLSSRHVELIALSEELDFAQAYAFLLDKRFGDALRVQVQVPADSQREYLPPLALQMLFENAIKHNVASRRHPLTIRLWVEGSQLLVSNNRQPRPDVGPVSRLGLQNICKRYAYLSDQQPLVEPTPTDFLVRLPLLSLTDPLPAA